MEDAEEQAQEVEVLRSIYEDSLVEDPASNSFALRLSVTVDPSLSVVCGKVPVDIPACPDTDGYASNAVVTTPDGLVTTRFPLRYLSPITFNFSYPALYPWSPPKVCLECHWLSQEQIAVLTAHLQQLWCEGCVCIFQMACFLSDEALAALELSGALHIACADSSQATATVQAMVEVDNDGRHDSFLREEHSCVVCLEERPGAEFVVLHGCYHAFCSECLHDFLTLHIAEGSIAQIKCPQMDCQKPIPQHCVQALASPTQYARFEQLQLQQSLQAMPDVFWCPRCNGPAIKEGDDLAECAACVFAFCVLCGSGWHPGVKCMSAADRVLYLAKRAASGGFSAEQSMEARRKHADALSQAESEKLISHSSKKCPGCGFGIERTSGCNKMHCVVCDCSFCWLCLQVVEGYGHFRGDLGNSKCAGRLFQGTEMDEYANQPMPVPGRQQLLQQEIRFQKCPRCKQNNVKEDKANHLKCWNCRCRFCYLCRVVCQGTSHFSRGGCPQHSDD